MSDAVEPTSHVTTATVRGVRSASDGAPTMDVASASLPSAITVRLGGRTYLLRSAPGCSICQHPNRLDIDRAIIKGYSTTTIAKSCPPNRSGKPVSPESLRHHIDRGHLPMSELVKRARAEAIAVEMGTDLETFEGSLANSVLLVNEVERMAMEAIAEGRLEPTVAEALKAVEIKERYFSEKGDQATAEQWAEAAMALVSSALSVFRDIEAGAIPASYSSMSAALGRAMADHPVLAPAFAPPEALPPVMD